MNSEYMGEPTQPLRSVPAPAQQNDQYQEPSYREHVSGNLFVHPADAPHFRPAYVPYPPPQHGQNYQGYPPGYGQNGSYAQPAPGPSINQPGYQGYSGYPSYPQYPGYNGYGYPYPGNYYPYPWQPAKPKRDGYLFGIAIASFVGSILVLLGGLLSLFFLLLFSIVPASGGLGASQRFSGTVLFTALAVAGILGGSFALYHSIRSLFFRKPSAAFKLPWFWLFLLLYLGVLAEGLILRAQGQAVTDTALTIFLISLAGLLPALTILALGVRRLHYPRSSPWPTTWRRFTLALVSGATLAILLASIFELILSAVAATSLGVTGISLDNPDQPIPSDPRAIVFLLLLVSVIAPIVEESVKPLAVVTLIGRINSAAEAFVLGLASGIGFDLVETSGYISQGYRNWIDVALQRSTAGLLHGLGAAMVALGWYLIAHPKKFKHGALLALGCWTYALLQHAIWNGSFVLQLLPAPIGPYLDTGTITIGSFSLPSFILVYIVESIIMLTVFLLVTGKLRGTSTAGPTLSEGETGQKQPADPGLQQAGMRG